MELDDDLLDIYKISLYDIKNAPREMGMFEDVEYENKEERIVRHIVYKRLKKYIKSQVDNDRPVYLTIRNVVLDYDIINDIKDCYKYRFMTDSNAEKIAIGLRDILKDAKIAEIDLFVPDHVQNQGVMIFLKRFKEWGYLDNLKWFELNADLQLNESIFDTMLKFLENSKDKIEKFIFRIPGHSSDAQPDGLYTIAMRKVLNEFPRLKYTGLWYKPSKDVEELEMFRREFDPVFEGLLRNSHVIKLQDPIYSYKYNTYDGTGISFVLLENYFKNGDMTRFSYHLHYDDEDQEKELYRLIDKFGFPDTLERFYIVKPAQGGSKNKELLYRIFESLPDNISYLTIGLDTSDEDIELFLDAIYRYQDSLLVFELQSTGFTDEKLIELFEAFHGNNVIQHISITRVPGLVFNERLKSAVVEMVRLSSVTELSSDMLNSKSRDLLEVPFDDRDIPIKSNAKSAAKITWGASAST